MTDAAMNGGALRGAVDLSSLVRAAQAPAPAVTPSGGPAERPSGVVREADEASFGEVVELSRTIPVIVEFYADGIAPALGAIVSSYGGRLVLVTVEGNRNAQLAQAFQIQQVPAAVALVGGRPVPLFVGIPGDADVRQVLDQVLELAAQNGVTGTAASPPSDEASGEPEDEPLPPLHQEAFDALSAGDPARAVAAYRTAITQNPRDELAVAGLAQALLLQRLEGADAAAVRSAAAAGPDDAEAQLAVADLDLSGGHVDDAFARLLRIFSPQSEETKVDLRTRLLEYFEIVGVNDERTVAARRALTNLLY